MPAPPLPRYARRFVENFCHLGGRFVNSDGSVDWPAMAASVARRTGRPIDAATLEGIATGRAVPGLAEAEQIARGLGRDPGLWFED